MPFFLWLRWLAGMKLNALHRKHLGFRVRDAAREVSFERAAMPPATSVALAAHLLGRLTRASEVAMRQERKVRLQERWRRWTRSIARSWSCATSRN